MNSFSNCPLKAVVDKWEVLSEEPTFDVELRDEFFAWDSSDDEEEIDKAELKFDRYMKKKEKHERDRKRLKTYKDYGTPNQEHPALNPNSQADQTIVLRKTLSHIYK